MTSSLKSVHCSGGQNLVEKLCHNIIRVFDSEINRSEQVLAKTIRNEWKWKYLQSNIEERCSKEVIYDFILHKVES